MTFKNPHGAMSQYLKSADNIEASRRISPFMRGNRQCCVRVVQHDTQESKHALRHMSRTEDLQIATKTCKADEIPNNQVVIPLAKLKNAYAPIRLVHSWRGPVLLQCR
jgi:hypothetical protein